MHRYWNNSIIKLNIMNTILYPTDFSENSINALPYAIDLAKRVNSRLVFLHVFEISLMAPANDFTSREQTALKVAEDVRTASRDRLAETLTKFDLEDLECVSLINEGKVEEEIIKITKSMKVDLIVLGTHGETGSRELLMGSVAVHVIRQAECPVLAIPQDAVFKPLKKIVYATELEFYEDKFFQDTLDIARFFDASVTFLHIHRYAEKPGDKMKDLEAFVERSDYGKIAIQDLGQDNTFERIDRYVKEHDIDLLAITTHTKSLFDRLFHRSLTKRMVLHSHIPLLAYSQKVFNTVFLG